MYELNARNHVDTVNFEEYYLESDYSLQMFKVACKCVDCKYAVLLNACTGEILLDYNGVTHTLRDYR